MLVYLKGRLIGEDDAQISALSAAFTHGPNVYETVRGYWDEGHEQLNLFRLRDHLRRFHLSMKALRYDQIPRSEVIADAILDCVRANRFRGDMHLRIHAFGADPVDKAHGTGTDLLIIPEPRDQKTTEPATCRIASWRRPPDDALPSRVKAVGNRMFARVAAAEARADGYHQVLLLNERGKLAEALSSNLFIVRHGVVCTPAITANILEGITRATLLAVLDEDMNRPAEEREIDRSELLDCEEAFLCSTGLEIVPIASVDGIALDGNAPGPMTTELTSRYKDILRGKAPFRAEWLTPVY